MTICLNSAYSTTRNLTKRAIPGGATDDSLRAQGYFKNSYPDKPLISVITVVFNGELFLEETIKSVLNQTYDNVEYLIIDGGSTDGTLDIIKRYKNQIDYWVSEPDKGIYDAMNKGIALASGTWLNFMNAGDSFNTSTVLNEIFTDSTQFQNIDFIYSDTRFDGRSVLTCSIEENIINHQSLIYKKKVHSTHGLYLVSKGLLISDYLFFMLCRNEVWYKSSTIIANYDTNGISGNDYFIEHFKQKVAVDLMFKNINRRKAGLALLLYPLKKRLLKYFKIGCRNGK